MPSCVTMKLNRGCFRGRKPETAQLSGFKTCNSFPFNKEPKKTAHFLAVFRPVSQPHPLQQGCNRMEGNEVLSKGAMSDEPNLNAYGPRRRIHRTCARLRCNLDIEGVRPR